MTVEPTRRVEHTGTLYKSVSAYEKVADENGQDEESLSMQTRRENAALKQDVGKAAVWILCIISLLGALAGFSSAVYSSRAKNSTEETTRVVAAVESIASDAVCRSEYAGRLNSARVYLDDLTAQITYAGLGIGLPAIVANTDGGSLPDKAIAAIALVDEATEKVPGARGAVKFYDDQYNALLKSQSDRAEFTRLCERGPLTSPD